MSIWRSAGHEESMAMVLTQERAWNRRIRPRPADTPTALATHQQPTSRNPAPQRTLPLYLINAPIQPPATRIVPTTVATETADGDSRYNRRNYRKDHDRKGYGLLREKDHQSSTSVNLGSHVFAVPAFGHSESPRTKIETGVFAHTRIAVCSSKRMALSTSKPIR
jgi:hypothetical protein